MNFNAMLLPARSESAFRLPDHYVWCGTMARGDDGKYYLYFSYWPKELGMGAWVTDSRVGVAVSDSPTGPFHMLGDALAPANIDGAFDRDCIHNPTVLKYHGRYYLYYMGNYGDGEYWNHRNHQRIGVAWSDSPTGPFHRSGVPLIDVTPGGCDSLMTSNPTVTVAPGGKFLMVYKAVSDKGAMPRGGAVVCGVATASDPLGPFVKYGVPIMANPENEWSVEDPYVWWQDGRYWALVKDFQGYFTGSQRGSVALFTSADGFDWHVDPEHPLAFNREVHWHDGSVQRVKNLERPQLWLDESVVPESDPHPRVLLCACDLGDGSLPFNIQIPLGSAD